MASKLVIVESPAKAKTIGKILGKEFDIKASYGHIRDLPEHTFGVDIENGFVPQYEESRGRARNLADLKRSAAKCSEIYLASDPDREGEAIAWHLYEVLRRSNRKADFKRVAFHEITRSAISKAFETPGKINMDLVDAQQARRVLDRIVGYMISPLLWSKIERGVSAGRVQSVALRLVCEREREIRAFVPKEYWLFQSLFRSGTGPVFPAKLFKINDGKFEIPDKPAADGILEDVKSVPAWKVAALETVPRKRYPAPPFITSTLQQAASSALGFSASSTMRIAQQLYEGIDTGSGSVGLITYMRTDSVNIAAEAQRAARDFIGRTCGPRFVPPSANHYRTKDTAQAAHEAIRPTDVNATPDSLRKYLDDRQYKLYKLIWNRFVACQMAPAEQQRTTADVCGRGRTLGNDYDFRAVATVTTFPGFLKVYNIAEEGAETDPEETAAADALALLKTNAPCTLKDAKGEQKFTEPPPRFSEATLIKELESNGIGRPSTYATIVNTIQEREYVNKEKGKLIPSDLGFRINDYLVSTLPGLIQVGFTADMENKLDSVEAGRIQWTGMLKEFYAQFSEWLAAAKSAGAPDADKAQALLQYLEGIRQWAPAEKVGKRTYDDRKFFDSVRDGAQKKGRSAAVSARQWEALMNLLVKYASQLPDAEDLAARFGFTDDLEKARMRAEEKVQKQKVYQQKREEAEKSAPPEHLSRLFQAMSRIPFHEPEKRGKRIYDDKKFFTSLREQSEAGRVLSEKQIAALLKMAKAYEGAIPGYEELVSHFASAVPAGAASPAPESSAAPVDDVLEAMSKITAWAEPVQKGRRIYDDKEFFDSLAKQRKQGRVLSFKQTAALMKLAAKYGIGAKGGSAL